MSASGGNWNFFLIDAFCVVAPTRFGMKPQQMDRCDWRRTERFDLSLSLAIGIAVVVAAALASFV
jgi:hypothetical protein